MTINDKVLLGELPVTDEQKEAILRALCADSPARRRRVRWDSTVTLNEADQAEFNYLRTKNERTREEGLKLANYWLRFTSKSWA